MSYEEFCDVLLGLDLNDDELGSHMRKWLAVQVKQKKATEKSFRKEKEFPTYEAAWAYQCLVLRDSDIPVVMLQRSQTDPRPNWVVRPARDEVEHRDAEFVRDMVRKAYAKKAARKAAEQGGAK